MLPYSASETPPPPTPPPGKRPDGVGPRLEGLDSADIEANRAIELQRPAAGCRLGAAEHDADLLAQLVGEDERGVGAVGRPGRLAQRLAHQPCLETDETVPHVALDL